MTLFVDAFRPGVALPPAEAGGRLGPGGLGGGAPPRECASVPPEELRSQGGLAKQGLTLT